MSVTLVFFESLAEELSSAQKELLALGGSLGEVVVVTGAEPEDAAEVLAVEGVQAVYTGDGEVIAPDPALADLLEQAVAQSGAEVVLGQDTADSVDVLARLAVRLEAGLITDAVGIAGAEGGLQVSKSVLAGAYTTTAGAAAAAADRPLMVTVKPNSVDRATVTERVVPGAVPELTVLGVRASEDSGLEILERTAAEASGRPALTEARVVVAGGRGVDGDFGPLEELADELGAAIGASRAATDAGWIDHSAQIGQTGVTVSPQLYLSVGISGAIQQKAGMQTSGTIVAINKDEDAPVFEIADFGVVGDLNDVVPQMIEELRRRKS